MVCRPVGWQNHLPRSDLWAAYPPPPQVTVQTKRAQPYEVVACPRRRRRKAASIRAVPARGMKEFFGMGAC